MKKLTMLMALVMIGALGCSSDSSSRVVAKVDVSTEYSTAVNIMRGKFAIDSYCMQRVQFVKDDKVTDERLLIAARPCEGNNVIADPVISKRLQAVSSSSAQIVSDKGVLLGDITLDPDTHWYLTNLCEFPNPGLKFDHCTVNFDAAGRFGPLTEKL